MSNQTFKDFLKGLKEEYSHRINTIAVFIAGLFFSIYSLYAYNTGIVKFCPKGPALCSEVYRSKDKGEFYAWVIILGLVGIGSLIYGVKLLANGNKKKNS